MDTLPQNKKQSTLEILFESLRPFLQSIEVDIETVKAMIELQVPGAFSKKAKAPAKKSAAKTATKKAAPKKKS